MKRRIASKRRRKFAWVFGATAIVIELLYWEQAAILYVLSTLAICALLLVVMFSNLEAQTRNITRQRLGKWMLGMQNQPAAPYQRRRWRKY